jgi:hemin uptake protein HemP
MKDVTTSAIYPNTSSVDAPASHFPKGVQPLALHSSQLFAHGDTVIIIHNHEQYRLRRTRQNRLILTK